MMIHLLWLLAGFFMYVGISFSDASHEVKLPSCKIADSIPEIPCDHFQIPEYTSYHTNMALSIDGHLVESDWKMARRSPAFRDLILGSETMYDTRVAVLWDQDYLYVGYWIQEPDVRATLIERDAPIYRDNDVELFIAGKDAYYEFEINAYGTIYEVFFIWDSAFSESGYDQLEEFNRDAQGVRTFKGVGFKGHPRGDRIGYWNWDFPGLKSAVQVNGTMNDSADHDVGWTVELAIPWNGMKALSRGDHRSLPPLDGDVWQMDFSRFNQYKGEGDSGGWAWSPHGVWDSHVPECFTIIHFSDEINPGVK